MSKGYLLLTTAHVKAWALGLVGLALAGCKPGLIELKVFDAAVTSVSAGDRDALITAGEEIYGRCKGCHSFGYNRVGPDHCGLAGRRAGGMPGYRYSPALKTADIIWTQGTLDEFLLDPRGMVPGTTMAYAGVKDDQDRRALVAYVLYSSVAAEACE